MSAIRMNMNGRKITWPLLWGGMAPLNNGHETSLALGLSYERRLTKIFGLEVLADFTIGSHERTALFATGLTYRPFTELG